ncbi:MAG: riboflavin synthase [Thermodesulfobacteriota bacterium]
MFTGIIEDIGKVKSVEKTGDSGRIEIVSSLDLSALPAGSSIAVDGACLTITDGQRDINTFKADLSGETMRSTTLGLGLRPGRLVNLERPLTLNKPLGGHLVTGHVDAVGRIRQKREKSAFLEMEVELPGALAGQVVVKGSITIDGISLTVTEASAGGVGLTLIPHTLKQTTLIGKSVGDFVNIETDIIAKYVERSLGTKDGGKVTEGFLREHGFLGRDG